MSSLRLTSGIIFSLVLVHLSAVEMYPKYVAGLLLFRKIDSKIEYLMLKSSKYHREWSFPKGGIDANEDALKAALRETEEETGYTVNDLTIYEQQFQRVNLQMKDGRKKVFDCWLAELKDAQLAPKLSHEHTEYQWLTSEQIKNDIDYPAYTELIEKIGFRSNSSEFAKGSFLLSIICVICASFHFILKS